MAFNDIFLNVLVKNAINGIEYLRLADTPSAVLDQIFEDPTLAPRKRQCRAVHLRIPPVEKDPQIANGCAVTLMVAAPAST